MAGPDHLDPAPSTAGEDVDVKEAEMKQGQNTQFEFTLRSPAALPYLLGALKAKEIEARRHL